MNKPTTLQRAKILLSTTKFIEDIKELRELFSIPSEGYAEREEIKQFSIARKMPKEFSQHVVSLRNNYNLPAYWQRFLVYYTLFNQQIDIDDLPVVSYGRNEGEKDLTMNIQIWDHTTIKDIKEIWDFVSDIKVSHFAFTKERYKLRDENLLERDIEILNCHLAGMSNKEIAIHMANLSEENSNKLFVVSEDQINKILESIKNTAGISES